MMQRRLVVLGLVLVIGMCSTGLWISTRPLVQPFLIPGATEIDVSMQGWGTQRIRYRVPPSSDAWYFTVGRTLTAQGWRSPTRYTGGPPADPDMYIRVTSFWRVALWERVRLGGRAETAQLTVQRWINITWP